MRRLEGLITARSNRHMAPEVHCLESTMDSKLRDFVRMNSPTFLGSKVREDLRKFLD